MIRTLQAFFYLTWTIVGILIIVSAFIVIATFPFEKVSEYLKAGTTEQRDLAGPPEEFGSERSPTGDGSSASQESRSINLVVTDDMRRDVAKVLGEERARQFKGYDDLTTEEVKKLEEYWGPRTPWLGQK
jgi:hypothetical protein